METILSFLINSAVRRAYLHGKEYLVAPVTSIVPGVMSGSDGPLFYPAEEIAKNPSDWNHVPLVCPVHPTVNGAPVSARDPDILEKHGVGILLRSKFIEKLQHEAWFDVAACDRVDKRLLPMVRNGNKIEVSTGLFLQKTPAGEGAVFNGAKYSYVTHSYKPDHLAILLDEKGACDVTKGCGIHINSADAPVANQKLSHSAIRDKLSEKLKEKHGYVKEDGLEYPACWLVEVFDREFVYSKGDDLYRQGYRTDNRTGELEIVGDPVEVHRSVSYKPVTNDGGGTVDRDATITWLVANCDCWKGADAKEVLNKASDDTLKNLKKKAEETTQIVANSAKQTFTDSLGNVHVWDVSKKEWLTQPKEEKKETPPVQNASQPITLEQLPAELKEDIAFARQIKTEMKNRHVATITANAQNKFTAEELQQMPLSMLEKLSAVAAPAQPAQPQFTYPSYGGAAVPPVHNTGAGNNPYGLSQEDLDAVVVPPTMDGDFFAARFGKK